MAVSEEEAAEPVQGHRFIALLEDQGGKDETLVDDHVGDDDCTDGRCFRDSR